MEVVATWTWILQAMFFGLGAVVAFVAPELVAHELIDSGRVTLFGVALARMLVPVQGALALFSSYASMRQHVPTRRALARTFALVFALWLLARPFLAEHVSALIEPESLLGAAIDALLVCLFAVNAAYAASTSGRSILGSIVARRGAGLALFVIAVALLLVRGTREGAILEAWVHGHPLAERVDAALAAVHWLALHEGGLFALVVFLALTMVFALRKAERATLAAATNTMPPGLWVLWSVQFIVLFALGTAMIFHPDEVVSLLVAEARRGELGDAVRPLVVHVGATWLGIAVITRIGLAATTANEWRLFARVHAGTFALQIFAGLLAWQPGLFNGSAMLVGALVLLFFALKNRGLVAAMTEATAEEIGEGPDGWTLMDLATGPALTIQSLSTRRRGTHLFGVAAEGTFHVLESQFASEPTRGHVRRAAPRPRHDFFIPGRELKVRARFSTVTYQDDACSDVRGAAIKVSYGAGDQTFDMLMNSGAISAVDHLKDFATLIVSKFLPEGIKEVGFKKSRPGIEAGVSGFRQSPSSYAEVHFYSQNVRHWIDPDDVRWLVRYRLVPCTRAKSRGGLGQTQLRRSLRESGIPDEKRRYEIWNRGRNKGDERPLDYLRHELRRRVEAGPARFLFQAQFHRPGPGDTLDWYNAGVDWPRAEHPWHDVARIELTRPLGEEETERLRFNSANHPASLGVPTATSWTDFRSMADSERRILRRLQGLRTWLYDNLGVPSENDR